MHAKTESLHLMWVEGMEKGFWNSAPWLGICRKGNHDISLETVFQQAINNAFFQRRLNQESSFFPSSAQHACSLHHVCLPSWTLRYAWTQQQDFKSPSVLEPVSRWYNFGQVLGFGSCVYFVGIIPSSSLYKIRIMVSAISTKSESQFQQSLRNQNHSFSVFVVGSSFSLIFQPVSIF